MNSFLKSVIDKITISNTTVTENNEEAYTFEGTLTDNLLSYLVSFNEKLIGNRGKKNVTTCGISKEKLDDLFFNYIKKVERLRNETDIDICLKYLFKLIIYTRDIENGKGERLLFYRLILNYYSLTNYCKKQVIELLPYLTGGYKCKLEKPYGSFLDLNKLIEVIYDEYDPDDYIELIEAIVELYIKNLKYDNNSLKPSLAAKWAPRINKSLDKKTNLGKLICERMYSEYKNYNTSQKLYRLLLSKINKNNNIPERNMSDNNWDIIELKHIPSKCFKKHKKALLNINKDGSERSTNYKRQICKNNILKELSKPIETSKLNVNKLQPYELIENYYNYDDIRELQWNKFKYEIYEKYKDSNFKQGLCVSDFSGSMSGIPMNVCKSLSILLSGMLPEPWKNQVITFEEKPQWVELDDTKSLYENVQVLNKAPWGYNTNFEAVFDLILNTAVKHKIPQDGMPEVLYIFSDMQFDQTQKTCGYYRGTNNKYDRIFEDQKLKIDRAFKDAGYNPPHLVFWNLRGDTDSHVASSESNNVSILSGFSSNIFKGFLDGTLDVCATPLDNLLNILDSERYDIIDQIYITQK